MQPHNGGVPRLQSREDFMDEVRNRKLVSIDLLEDQLGRDGVREFNRRLSDFANQVFELLVTATRGLLKCGESPREVCSVAPKRLPLHSNGLAFGSEGHSLQRE